MAIQWVEVAHVRSRRTDEKYRVDAHPDTGALRCQCMKYVFSKATPKTCHHIEGVVAHPSIRPFIANGRMTSLGIAAYRDASASDAETVSAVIATAKAAKAAASATLKTGAQVAREQAQKRIAALDDKLASVIGNAAAKAGAVLTFGQILKIADAVRAQMLIAGAIDEQAAGRMSENRPVITRRIVLED